MKKIVSLFLALTMLSLTACGGAQSAPPSGEEENAAKTSVSAQSEQSAEQAESGADTQSPAQEPKGGSTLIVYFSESGNTETIANYIHEAVGGDIARIVSVVEYPHEYEELADYAKGEQDRDERPAFEDLGVDPTSYDTVFIGYPIWWYSLPMILETFFDTYDFTGVTIVPFNTHEGSRDGGTYDMIRDREPGANVLEGLPIRGGDVDEESSKAAVQEWIAGLGLE